MRAIDRAVSIVGSQAKLAEKIGVSQGRVSQWVAGADIHPRYFQRIADATEDSVTPLEMLADEMAKARAPAAA